MLRKKEGSVFIHQVEITQVPLRLLPRQVRCGGRRVSQGNPRRTKRF